MEQIKPYIKTFGMSFMTMACILSLSNIPATLASDHVDSPSVSVAGPTYTDPNSSKPSVASGKPEDITDVYAFREQDQSGQGGDAGRLCVIMTLNGLQAPGQGRPFAPDVAYQLKVATDKTDLDNALKTRTFSFRFGLPKSDGTQDMYLSGDQTPGTVSIGNTTAFNQTANVVNLAGLDTGIKVFAGETDDPFFLDFRIINEGLAFGVNGTGSTMGAGMGRTPSDTFGSSNVNAIVVSLPVTLLPTPAVANTYAVWGRTLK